MYNRSTKVICKISLNTDCFSLQTHGSSVVVVRSHQDMKLPGHLRDKQVILINPECIDRPKERSDRFRTEVLLATGALQLEINCKNALRSRISPLRDVLCFSLSPAYFISHCCNATVFTATTTSSNARIALGATSNGGRSVSRAERMPCCGSLLSRDR